MTRKDSRVTRKLRKPLQAAIYLVGVAAGKVGASAAVEEQRVTGDQAVVEQKALAAGRVTRSVQQLDFDIANADYVVVLMGGQVAEANPGDPRNPQRLMGVHVHRHGRPLQQLGQAL